MSRSVGRPVTGVGKRIGLTLRPELDEVLTHISNFRNEPKTAIINDFLTEALPAFQAISEAYKQIEQNQNPQAALNSLVGKMMQSIGQFGKEIEDHSNSQLKKCPDTIEMDLKPE